MFAATFPRMFPLVATLAVGLALGACARNNADADALNGAYSAAGAPGSVQEFAASVGDRVFFDTDSTELTSAGQATMDKQAAWLNNTPATPSPSRVTPTSAARASITSPWAPGAPTRPRTT